MMRYIQFKYVIALLYTIAFSGCRAPQFEDAANIDYSANNIKEIAIYRGNQAVFRPQLIISDRGSIEHFVNEMQLSVYGTNKSFLWENVYLKIVLINMKGQPLICLLYSSFTVPEGATLFAVEKSGSRFRLGPRSKLTPKGISLLLPVEKAFSENDLAKFPGENIRQNH